MPPLNSFLSYGTSGISSTDGRARALSCAMQPVFSHINLVHSPSFSQLQVDFRIVHAWILNDLSQRLESKIVLWTFERLKLPFDVRAWCKLLCDDAKFGWFAINALSKELGILWKLLTWFRLGYRFDYFRRLGSEYLTSRLKVNQVSMTQTPETVKAITQSKSSQ